MKKVFAVIAVAALVGVTSSWAAVVTNVADHLDLTIKGKLSTKATVTGADLAAGTVSWLSLDLVTDNVATTNAVAALKDVKYASLTMATNTGTVVTNNTIVGTTTNLAGYTGTGTATATLSNGWVLTFVAATNIVATGPTTNIVNAATNVVYGTLTMATNTGTVVAGTNDTTGVTNSITGTTTATAILSNGWTLTFVGLTTNVYTTTTATNSMEAIGKYNSPSNAVVYLGGIAYVDLTPTSQKSDKFVGAFQGTSGKATNAVILVSGTSKTKVTGTTTNTTLNAKIQGIWDNGVSTITGTLKSP
ncbi:MAG: hypothetical protein ABSC38_06835 [Verrucomicrobiia bacterium]